MADQRKNNGATLAGSEPPARVFLSWTPVVLVALILACAGLLSLPAATAVGRPQLSWLDTIFTAASAITLTGLTIRDTATQFSPAGQAVIAVSIQAAGLIYM